jgi:putative transposase
MKRQRFSEEHIRRIVPEAEPLDHVREVCQQHTVTEQTGYRWRRQCGGLAVADAKHCRTLARDHAALKRLVGARTLAKRLLKEGVGKHW